MRRAARLGCLLALLGGGARAADRLPLEPGESLTYQVSWVVLPFVGQIEIAAKAAGPGRLSIVSRTSSAGIARLLLPFEARAEELFDAADGRLLSLEETSDTRGRRKSHRVSFDYRAGTATYLAADGPPRPEKLDLPPGYPTDLITGLLSARRWDLAPGGKRDLLVLFEDDFYRLTVHAVRYETVATPLGSYRALLLEPRMEETPPKGMFRRGSSVRVWISQDAARLPVRFEVLFRFGYGVAELTAHRPPGPSP